MKLSAKAIAISFGLLWGGGILVVGLVNLACPAYGAGFLTAVSSVYPWFHASRKFSDVVIGTVDGLIDGLVGGFVFAWLYNLFS